MKELHATKTKMVQELIESGVVPLRPGVLAVVDQAIAAGAPMAVCSTSNEMAVRTLVETLMGAERYAAFQFFCGDVVPRKKPAPDVYNLAAEKMSLDKAACVVIEDSGIGAAPVTCECGPAIERWMPRRAGCKAAKAAGMACLVTISTYTAEEDFAGADRIVPELEAAGVGLDDLRALLCG